MFAHFKKEILIRQAFPIPQRRRWGFINAPALTLRAIPARTHDIALDFAPHTNGMGVVLALCVSHRVRTYSRQVERTEKVVAGKGLPRIKSGNSTEGKRRRVGDIARASKGCRRGSRATE